MAEPAEPVAPESDVERAWREEIRRRVDVLRSGEAILVDGDEALASVRARIAKYTKD